MIDRPPASLNRLLRGGGALLAVVGFGMLATPSVIAALFGLDLGAGGEFMTRRYGASGLVGLGIALWLAADTSAPVAVLGGVAGWFFVQAAASTAALLVGTVSGVAWITLLADPALGIGAAVLANRLSASPNNRGSR